MGVRVGGSDCSASRVLSYCFTRRATKEDLQLKTYHHRNVCGTHHNTMNSGKRDPSQETIEKWQRGGKKNS